MWEYQDRSITTIKSDVEKAFKKLDKLWYRDDQEIIQAGINICRAYKAAIRADKSLNYWKRALEPFTKLEEDFSKERKNLKGTKLFTENKKVINDIANRIDNAEKIVLERLRRNNRHKKNNRYELKGRKTNRKKIFQFQWKNRSVYFYKSK